MDFKSIFTIIDDPRHQGYITHKLEDVLTIIVCAVFSGMDTLSGIMLYAENHVEFLSKEFCIFEIPSKATFARILSIVDGEQVGQIVIDLMKKKLGTQGDIIAVDGKMIRSTNKTDNKNNGLQILTAYLTDNAVILGQKAIGKKTNEIPEFQNMLETLNIEGKTITADAMHCQKETCKRISEKGGTYLLGLKQNQPALYSNIELFFEDDINANCFETHTTKEQNSGRIETIICKKILDITWLPQLNDWSNLKSIISIRRIVQTKNHNSDETSFYISSLDESPEKLMRIAREHWKIESMHWMLDVSFSEDSCRFLSENAHKTLNSMRKFALSYHKQYISKIDKKKPTIKGNMISCSMNSDLLLKVIQNL